ncbi:hypothetical protein CEXT_73651, partial [Caerostris extrusa]
SVGSAAPFAPIGHVSPGDEVHDKKRNREMDEICLRE